MTKQNDKMHFYVSVLLYSLVIAAFAQFRLDILMQYFMVSLGIVLVPLFYVMIEGFPLMPVAVVSGLFVSVSRLLTDYFGGAEVGAFSTAYFPETFFYIIYAFLLLMYCDSKKRRLDKLPDILALTLVDYVANMMELVLREGVHSYTFENQMGILFVGLVRSVIVFLVLYLFRSYKMMLMKHEDVKMYKQLLMTTTELAGETVFMRENMALVENTMNDAYKLYDGLKAADNKDGAQRALNVATNVHEIKKQYQSILTGLRSALDQNLEQKSMFVSEVATILLSNLKETANEQGVNLSYRISCPENLSTEKYYYLMSVLNNLFTNALEAANGDHQEIDLNVVENGEKYMFTVTNTGKPIPEDALETIWEPGYSTKINYENGVVGRGLGLLVVKNIIENEFEGQVGVHSNDMKTSFVFEIPKIKLEA